MLILGYDHPQLFEHLYVIYQADKFRAKSGIGFEGDVPHEMVK